MYHHNEHETENEQRTYLFHEDYFYQKVLFWVVNSTDLRIARILKTNYDQFYTWTNDRQPYTRGWNQDVCRFCKNDFESLIVTRVESFGKKVTRVESSQHRFSAWLESSNQKSWLESSNFDSCHDISLADDIVLLYEDQARIYNGDSGA